MCLCWEAVAGGTRRVGALSRGEVAPSPGGLSAPKGSVATRQVARRQQKRSGQPGTGGEAGVTPWGCHRRWPLAWLEHRVPVPSSEGSASAAGPCPQVIFLPALCINQIILQARGKAGWKTSVTFPHSFSNHPCNIFFLHAPGYLLLLCKPRSKATLLRKVKTQRSAEARPLPRFPSAAAPSPLLWLLATRVLLRGPGRRHCADAAGCAKGLS